MIDEETEEAVKQAIKQAKSQARAQGLKLDKRHKKIIREAVLKEMSVAK